MEITNIPERIKKKLELVIDKSKFHFKELEVEGYFFDGVNYDKKVAVDHVIKIDFLNKPKNLLVEICYEPINIEGGNSDFISVSIKKESSPKDYINLKKLLRKYFSNLAIDKKGMSYINLNKNGSFEENLDKTLQLNLMYLLECAKDVIKGKFWIDDLKFEWTEELDKLLYEKQKDIIYGKKGKKNKNNDRG